jgi:hypothetical protein
MLQGIDVLFSIVFLGNLKVLLCDTESLSFFLSILTLSIHFHEIAVELTNSRMVVSNYVSNDSLSFVIVLLCLFNFLLF